MITIKAAFTDKDTMLGFLGRVGENGTRQIEFDCAEILTEYPAAVIVCAVKRPGEASAYYADMQAEGALRRLILRDVETEKPGTLKLELSALDGEKQRRTTLYAGAIASGLTRTDEEPSDPEKDLIDYIADAETVKQEASNAAKDARAAAGRATDAASEIENMTANAVTLAPGEHATANYNAGVLTLGVPKGDPGEPGSDAAVTKQNIEAALGYAPGKALTSENYNGQIENLFPDKITIVVNNFWRYGNICTFVLQINVPETIAFSYGANIAKLPFASSMRCWLNNSKDYYIDNNTQYISRNGRNISSGNYVLSGVYISNDAAASAVEATSLASTDASFPLENEVNKIQAKTDALESASDDIILMMADLIGGGE